MNQPSADLPSWARGHFEQVALHEAIHVSALTPALGKDAVRPCKCPLPSQSNPPHVLQHVRSPYTDPASFASLLHPDLSSPPRHATKLRSPLLSRNRNHGLVPFDAPWLQVRFPFTPSLFP